VADLLKVAAVLEAAADYYEENEREKTSASESVRAARLDKIAAAHLATHGEEMSNVERAKLAKADDGVLDYIEGSLTKHAGNVTPLGAGVDPENRPPQTVKEAAADADSRFLSWITS
jgi:hypothetical protein